MDTGSSVNIGRVGEEHACSFLQKKGFRILGKNYRLGQIGEIDIIARAPSGILVFVEVKSGVGLSDYLKPEQHFNEEKIWRVRRLAQNFVNSFPNYISKKLGFRIDLVVVIFEYKDSGKNLSSSPLIHHYENF